MRIRQGNGRQGKTEREAGTGRQIQPQTVMITCPCKQGRVERGAGTGRPRLARTIRGMRGTVERDGETGRLFQLPLIPLVG